MAPLSNFVVETTIAEVQRLKTQSRAVSTLDSTVLEWVRGCLFEQSSMPHTRASTQLRARLTPLFFSRVSDLTTLLCSSSRSLDSRKQALADAHLIIRMFGGRAPVTRAHVVAWMQVLSCENSWKECRVWMELLNRAVPCLKASCSVEQSLERDYTALIRHRYTLARELIIKAKTSIVPTHEAR